MQTKLSKQQKRILLAMLNSLDEITARISTPEQPKLLKRDYFSRLDITELLTGEMRKNHIGRYKTRADYLPNSISASVSRSLIRLEQRGLIARFLEPGEDEGDVKVYRFTKLGRSVLKEAKPNSEYISLVEYLETVN